MKKSIGLLLAILIAGCASHRIDNKMPPPSPTVPPAPTYTPTPIDPELRARAISELLSQTTAADPFLRSNAIEALSDADPADAANAVLVGLKDSDSPVRFAAAMAAGQMKLVDAYRQLRAMAYDRNLRVEVGVRFALHELGDTRLSHDLEKFAVAPDPHLRATVAEVLGLLKNTSATPMLLRMLSDPDIAVRLEAAEALWRLGDFRGLDELVAFSISAYPDDQMVALRALAEPRDVRVIQHIRGELTNDYVEVSLVAARALGMLGSDEGWNVAVPAAHSKDPRQRALAAWAMGAIGRPDLQRYLAELLKDPQAEVRIAAARAILKLHPPTDFTSVD